jgi:pimeloyl-ACP methyl ester carboxylesterase
LRLARRWRLPEPAVERVVIELPTPGHHIALHHYPPETPRYEEPVILCPGLAANRYNMDFLDDGRGRDRSSLARYLARLGFDVWVLEPRGRGWARAPRRARWTLFDEVREDAPTAIETVLDLSGRDAVFWVGHSWGGLMQLVLQAQGGEGADKVAGIVALGSPALFGRRGVLARLRRLDPLLGPPVGLRLPLRLVARFMLPVVGLLNALSRVRWPRLAPLSTRLLRHLLASLAEDIPPGIVRQLRSWARVNGPVDLAGAPIPWGTIERPLLLVSGTMDWIAGPEAMRPILDAARSEDRQLVVVGRDAGYAQDFGHGGLLLSEPAPDVVFPIVADWLQQRARRGGQRPDSGARPDALTGRDHGPSGV